MPRLLLYLVVIGAVIAGLLWAAQRPRGRRPLPGPAEGAPAVLVFGPECGAGRLRATSTQLIFEAASGRVVVIERIDITGVGLTRDLPDRATAAPVLVVSTAGEVLYFGVEDAAAWVRRLT